MPKGYDSDIGDAGRFLSAGQRQQIGLARAFYGNPALLVLDEPNSNLDSVSEDALSEALAGAKERGVTIVVVTHRPSVLRASDQLLLLKDGSVELYGPSEGVMARMRQGALPHEKRERIGADNKTEAKRPAAAETEQAQSSQGRDKPKQTRPTRRARRAGNPPKPQPAAAPPKAPEVIVNRESGKAREGVPENKPARPVIESSVVRVDALLAKGDKK